MPAALLHAALLLLAPALQEPAPEPSQEPALELLRAVAVAQAPGTPGKQVDGFRQEVVLRDFAADGTREVGLNLRYTLRPQETVELIVDENGVQVAKGYDGRDYWLLESGAEKRVDLGGHEYEKDREGIDQVLDLCADLMLLLDLDQLEKRCSGLRLEELEDGRRRLDGRLDASAGAWEFALFLPAEKLEPSAFWLYHRNPEPRPEGDPGDWEPVVDVQRFELRHWRAFHGRRAPQVVDVYDSLRKVDRETGEELLPTRTLELHDIRWTLSDAPREDADTPSDARSND